MSDWADADRRRQIALTDARMLKRVLTVTSAAQLRVPTRTLRVLTNSVIDQADEIESLRDRESQSAPRVITTIKEAEALPEGAVIVTAGGECMERSDSAEWSSWYVFASEISVSLLDDQLPATLIHIPNPTTEGTPS